MHPSFQSNMTLLLAQEVKRWNETAIKSTRIGRYDQGIQILTHVLSTLSWSGVCGNLLSFPSFQNGNAVHIAADTSSGVEMHPCSEIFLHPFIFTIIPDSPPPIQRSFFPLEQRLQQLQESTLTREQCALIVGCCFYNMGLTHHLQWIQTPSRDSLLITAASFYQSALEQLCISGTEKKPHDSTLLILMAICSNLCHAFSELGQVDLLFHYNTLLAELLQTQEERRAKLDTKSLVFFSMNTFANRTRRITAVAA